MSSAQRQYTDEMHDHFGGYYAAWTPGDPLQLGDIGVLEGNAFRRIGSLAERGFRFAEQPDPSPEMIGPYQSQSNVSVSFKAQGVAAPPNSFLAEMDAGFSIQFTRENATVFVAEGCYQPSIKDQIQLGKEILAAFKAGEWDKNWHVITQIVQASSATVLISSSSEGHIDIKLAGKVGATPSTSDLAKIDAGLEVKFSRAMHTQLVAGGGITPIFRLSRVRKPIFGKPSWQLNKSLVTEGKVRVESVPMEIITPALLESVPQLEEHLSFGEV